MTKHIIVLSAKRFCKKVFCSRTRPDSSLPFFCIWLSKWQEKKASTKDVHTVSTQRRFFSLRPLLSFFGTMSQFNYCSRFALRTIEAIIRAFYSYQIKKILTKYSQGTVKLRSLSFALLLDITVHLRILRHMWPKIAVRFLLQIVIRS